MLAERMKALDLKQNENYKFLKINTDAVYERVKAEMDKGMKALASTELYKRNLIKAINTRVVPGARFVINVCDFKQKQIDDLDKLIKKAKDCMVDKLVMRGSILS